MNSENKKYLIVLIVFILLFAVGCGQTMFKVGDYDKALLPIAKNAYGKGGSWDFLVYPMAWLMFGVANIVGKNYALTILITTILIRSIAWPIYGKTNDMSLKMSLIAPEQQKIEAKYEGKVDKESQQRKSMELMQLYKKYKISFTGCLMPFIQMPIFLAFYETLRRIPFTSQQFIDKYGTTFINSKKGEVQIGELLYNVDDLNTKFLGINLLEDKSAKGWQMWGIIILAALVAITQLGTQILSQRRTKKQKDKMEGNIPEYRRKGPSDQQKQTEIMMKVMLYSMPVMMVIFILQSPAALGWYWLVGNLFTALQGYISSKQSEKKLEKLREKFNNNIIRY